MAGTSDNKAGSSRRQVASPVPYLDYDEFVEIQIAKTRENLRSNEIVTALTELAVLFAGYLLFAVVCDHWLVEGGLSSNVRLLMLAALVMTAGAIAVRRVVWPLIRRINPLYAARMIEEAEERFQGNLVNWIDLKANGRKPEQSAAIRAIEKRAAVGLDRMDVDTAVDRRPLLRAAYALLGVVVVSAMYVAFSPKDPFSSVQRALLPLASVGVPTETTISDITPGNVEVAARGQVIVEADLRGKVVDRVQVLLTTADHKFVDHPVEMRRIESGLPRFRGILNGENGRGLLQDQEYRIVAGDAESPSFQIRVIQPPSAQVEQLTYTYPNYMQLPSRIAPGPAVEGWEGTRVAFEARTNMPVSQARLVLTDNEQVTQGEEVPLQVTDGNRLTGAWTLAFRSDGTAPRFYHIAVKTADGAVDPNPVRVPIEVRADQRPDVALLSPTADLEKPANAIIPLAILASDPDFQLRSLTLKAERNGSPLPDQPLFESDFPARKVEGTFDWDLGALGLQPGERIQFWIEARDNRQPVANRTNTPRLSLLIDKPFESDQQAQRDLADAKNQLQDELAAGQSQRDPGEGSNDSSQDDSPPSSDNPRPTDDRTAAQPENGSAEEDPQDAARQDRRDEAKPEDPADFQDQLERLLRREERGRELSEPQSSEPAESTPHGDPDEPNSAEPRDGSRDPVQEQSRQEKSQAKSGNQRGKSGPSGSRPAQNPADEGDLSADSREDGEKATGKSTGSQSNPSGGKSETSKRGAPPQDAVGDESAGAGEVPQSAGRQEGTDPPEKSANKPSEKSRNNDGEKRNRDPQRNDPAEATGSDEESQSGGVKGGESDPQRGDDLPQSSQQERRQPGKSTNQEREESESGNAPASDPDGGEESAESTPNESAAPPEKDTPGKGTKSPEIPAGERPPRPGQKSSRKEGQSATQSPEGDSENSDEESSQGESGQQSGSPQSGNSQKQRGTGSRGGSQSSRAESGEANSEESTGNNSQSNDSPNEGQQSRTSQSSRHPPGKSGQKQPRQGTGASKADSNSDDSEEASGDENQDGQDSSDDGADEVSRTKASRGNSKSKAESRSGNSKSPSDSTSKESAPRGKEPSESLEHADDPSERTDEGSPRQTPSKRPGTPPEAGNRPPKGKGRPEGQQSQQPETGEQGRSSSSDQGESGGNQEGAGEQTGEAGESSSSSRETGKTGSQPGSGKTGNRPSSTGKPGSEQGASGKSSQRSQGDASGAPSGESGGGDPEGAGAAAESEGGEAGDSSSGSDSPAGKQGGSQGKSSGNSQGASSDQSGNSGDSRQSGGKSSSGSKPGQGSAGAQTSPAGEPGSSSSNPSPSGGGRMGNNPSRSGPNDKPGPAEQGRGVPEGKGRNEGEAGAGESGTESGDTVNPDEQKLEHLKEASNLVLQKLKGQLSRGEIDPDSLEELGWKDLGQLRKFVSRLEEELSPSDDQSPEALARRRQFEELLKSMTLDDRTQAKERGTGAGRRVEQVDAGRRPVPNALRSRYEAYTRSLSKGDKGSEKTPAKTPPVATGTP